MTKRQPRVDELAEDEVLQNTAEGYEVTKVDDIPLSEKAGEKRLED